MSEKPKTFPNEGSDFPKKGDFYPQSLRPDKPSEQTGQLPDPGEETGNPGDLGGGYNSLGVSKPKPAEVEPKSNLDRVREAKETLRQNKPEDL